MNQTRRGWSLLVCALLCALTALPTLSARAQSGTAVSAPRATATPTGLTRTPAPISTPRIQPMLAHQQAARQPQRKLSAGQSGDLWADVELGRRNFGELSPGEITGDYLQQPGGIAVDRTVSPGRMYVWDSGHSRILGVDLGTCYAALAAGGTCVPQIVIGQPQPIDWGACNHDASLRTYPVPARAADDTLCGIRDETHTVLEDKSFTGLAVDTTGNLWVADVLNNRVLRYNSPFTTDTVADDVWGQPDFASNGCNVTGNRITSIIPAPTASTLCFLGNGSGAAVTFDLAGNLWVADGGNNRVVRFSRNPATGVIAKTADLVLGQQSFIGSASGSTLSEFWWATGLGFDMNGRLYVADLYNYRVLAFSPPFVTGMAGAQFGPTYAAGHYLYGLSATPNGDGIWTYDLISMRLWNLDGTVRQTPYFPWCGGGSVDADAAGGLLVAITCGAWTVMHYDRQPDGSYVNPVWLFPLPSGYGNVSAQRIGNTAWAGMVVAGNQVVLADGRLTFWNNRQTVTTGQAADGYLAAASFSDLPSAQIHRIGVSLSHLYVGVGSAIKVYALPLHTGDNPVATIVDTINLLGGGLIGGAYSDVSPSSDDRFLWIAQADNARVLRVRDPLTSPVVDVVVGQLNANDHNCNRATSGQVWAASYPLDLLCLPGSVALDRRGNLYVSDNMIEAGGNWRMLMYAAALFPNAPATPIYGTAATKSFPFPRAAWKPAFDSANRMYVGYNPYSGTRFVDYYHDPTRRNAADPQDPTYATPDGQLLDYTTWPLAASVDADDNVYILDANRGQVRIYWRPFDAAPPATPTPTPLVQVATPTRTPTAVDPPRTPTPTPCWPPGRCRNRR